LVHLNGLDISPELKFRVDLKLIKFGARYEFIVEVKPTASSRLQRVVRGEIEARIEALTLI